MQHLSSSCMQRLSRIEKSENSPNVFCSFSINKLKYYKNSSSSKIYEQTKKLKITSSESRDSIIVLNEMTKRGKYSTFKFEFPSQN